MPYQPLTAEETGNGVGAGSPFGLPVPLCKPREKIPCAREAYRNGPHRYHYHENVSEPTSGHKCANRSGCQRSPNTGLKNACELVGIAIGSAALADVPGWIAAAIFGGGSAAQVACRHL